MKMRTLEIQRKSRSSDLPQKSISKCQKTLIHNQKAIHTLKGKLSRRNLKSQKAINQISNESSIRGNQTTQNQSEDKNEKLSNEIFNDFSEIFDDFTLKLGQSKPLLTLEESDTFNLATRKISLSLDAINEDIKKDNHLMFVQPINYLPNLPSSQRIEEGDQVTFAAHLTEILKYYDVIPAPKTLLTGLQLPQQGKFFLIKPDNPEDWWKEKVCEHQSLQTFLNKEDQ